MTRAPKATILYNSGSLTYMVRSWLRVSLPLSLHQFELQIVGFEVSITVETISRLID